LIQVDIMPLSIGDSECRHTVEFNPRSGNC
jgi:hypothetical protein